MEYPASRICDLRGFPLVQAYRTEAHVFFEYPIVRVLNYFEETKADVD